jgi:hypothetical protein
VRQTGEAKSGETKLGVECLPQLLGQTLTNMCTIDPQTRTCIPCGIEVKQCVIRQWDIGGDCCENSAVEGSEFCEEHVGVRLCKASGIQYRWRGNSKGWFILIETIYPHLVDTFENRTKRAEFCSDRCRNLWRDTKKSRERQVEVEKLERGERSSKYELIRNYRNSGDTALLDKETNRIVG